MDARRHPERALSEWGGRRRSGAARQEPHVSIGSFLDLRYLVDSGRLSEQVLGEGRSIVEEDAFTVVPLDIRVLDKMGAIPRAKVPDPFDRIIAATALTLDLPLISADEDIRGAIGELVIW